MVAATAAAFAWTGTGSAVAQTIQVKIAHATINDVQDEWAKRFKDRLEKRSNGRFEAKVYPLSQLGITPRQIEGLQLGTIEFMAAPPQFLVGVDPRYQVVAAPGLFDNLEHARKVISDPRVRDAVLSIGEAKGLVGVSFFIYGPGGFQTREPLPSPESLKGKKIRVLAADVEIEPVKHYGGTGVPMALGELLSAMQQGVVDGSSTSLTVASSFKMYSIAKYHTESVWQIHTSVALASKVWLDKLPADLRAIVLEEGKAVEPELFDWMVGHQKRARDEWEKNGGVFTEWPAADRPKMMATLSSIAAKIVAKDPGSKKLYDTVVAVAKEKRQR
jgi:TRAP-type C4-dicarboxylate transport system substrate-binding protein